MAVAQWPCLAGHTSLAVTHWPCLTGRAPLGLSGAGISRAGICSPCSPRERRTKQSPAQKGSRPGFVQGWGHSPELEEGLSPHTNDTEPKPCSALLPGLCRGEQCRGWDCHGNRAAGLVAARGQCPCPHSQPWGTFLALLLCHSRPRVQAEELQLCPALPSEQPGVKGAWHGLGECLRLLSGVPGKNIPGKLQRPGEILL